MATWYRTKFGVFSVSHGYCIAVYDRDGKKDEGSRFVALALMGVVRKEDVLAKDVLRMDVLETDSDGEYRLLFGSGSATITTEIVMSIEHKADVSIAPPDERITIISGRPPPRLPSFFPPSSKS